LYGAARKGETIPFGELLVNVRQLTEKQKRAIELAKKQGRDITPATIPSGKILGQNTNISLDHDPRNELMEWLRDPSNPYFAKAIVNRVWSNYFGIGLVDPTDDMNLANPPSNGPLMDYLADEFVKNEFDLKWLHRAITTSDTYQRSVEPNESNQQDQKNFARHVPRRLPAEVIYDAVMLATGSDAKASLLRDELNEMAIADGKPKRRNQQDFALEVFGQSIRESNCDCDRSDSPSLLQSVYLRNDSEMHQRIMDSSGWVTQACKEIGVQGPIEMSDAQYRTAFNRANTIRKQVVNQASRFHQATEQQQLKMRKTITSELQRASQKIESLGFQMPPITRLLSDKQKWESLEPLPSKTAKHEDLQNLVEQAYLRTLSRYPDIDEVNISVDYITQSETPANGVASLLWALVNTKEFIITH
jgi:hypothetical protein